MAVRIKQYSECSKECWDVFVNQSYHGWIWHLSDFIEVKLYWENHSNLSFAVVDEGDEIVAIFPLFLIGAKKFRVLNTPTFDNIGGWVIDPQIKDKQPVLNALKEECQKIITKNNCSLININFATASLLHDKDPLFFSGIEGQSAYIGVLDLTKEISVLWSNIRKGHKSEINKGEKKGLSFRLATTQDLGLYYEMHEATCKRSDIQPHPKPYFEKIFRYFIPSGKSIVGLAYEGRNPIAVANYAVYKGVSTYWTGASFDTALKNGANHFLHWKLIQELKTNNVQKIDMGPLISPNATQKIQGIGKFKTGFGGEILPIYKYSQTERFVW